MIKYLALFHFIAAFLISPSYACINGPCDGSCGGGTGLSLPVSEDEGPWKAEAPGFMELYDAARVAFANKRYVDAAESLFAASELEDREPDPYGRFLYLENKILSAVSYTFAGQDEQARAVAISVFGDRNFDPARTDPICFTLFYKLGLRDHAREILEARDEHFEGWTWWVAKEIMGLRDSTPKPPILNNKILFNSESMVLEVIPESALCEYKTKGCTTGAYVEFLRQSELLVGPDAVHARLMNALFIKKYAPDSLYLALCELSDAVVHDHMYECFDLAPGHVDTDMPIGIRVIPSFVDFHRVEDLVDPAHLLEDPTFSIPETPPSE